MILLLKIISSLIVNAVNVKYLYLHTILVYYRRDNILFPLIHFSKISIKCILMENAHVHLTKENLLSEESINSGLTQCSFNRLAKGTIRYRGVCVNGIKHKRGKCTCKNRLLTVCTACFERSSHRRCF